MNDNAYIHVKLYSILKICELTINEQEILIVHDDKLVTWLNATDLAVRAGLYWFIEKHPEAGIIDLLNFRIEQEFECGLIFDGSEVALLPGQST